MARRSTRNQNAASSAATAGIGADDSATDDEAMHAFRMLNQREGILPALETSHALAWVVANAPKMSKDDIILVNLSGRGDKDILTVADIDGITLT